MYSKTLRQFVRLLYKAIKTLNVVVNERKVEGNVQLYLLRNNLVVIILISLWSIRNSVKLLNNATSGQSIDNLINPPAITQIHLISVRFKKVFVSASYFYGSDRNC